MRKVITTFFFIFIIGILHHQDILAQPPSTFKEYIVKQVYDADGYPSDKVVGPKRIQITITNFIGNSTLMINDYNEILGMYSSTYLTLYYRGINNGWHIYSVDTGMMGQHFIYVRSDFSAVRTCLSFWGGYFVEYRPFIKGEDINMPPSY